MYVILKSRLHSCIELNIELNSNVLLHTVHKICLCPSNATIDFNNHKHHIPSSKRCTFSEGHFTRTVYIKMEKARYLALYKEVSAYFRYQSLDISIED